LHTATLLHDDVVDVSDMRRQQRTARVVWGNAASVLVGDYLLAIAFRSLTLLKNLTVLDTISDTTSLMAKGEILQLIRRYDTASEADYLAIIIHKTASLFAAAAKIGACFGGAGEEEQRRLYQYGHELGIAFQIVDDALDYVEERDKVGKPLGTDFKERKVTLPLSRLLGLLKGQERDDLLARLARDEIGDGDVHDVVRLMQREDVLPYTLNEARKYVELAKSRLEGLPNLTEKERLSRLADFVVDREF
jgi:octaprenyl-diphosphate synthase